MKNRVYRQIQSQNRILGLEIADFLGVVFFFVVVLNLADGIVVPFFMSLVAHGAIWFLKRGKPSHWTPLAIRYLARPRFLSAGAPDRLARTYPVADLWMEGEIGRIRNQTA